MGKPKKPRSAIKVRRRWKINPKTKVKESAKRYLRRREKQKARKLIKNTSEKNA